jgi:hypothetical protein
MTPPAREDKIIFPYPTGGRLNNLNAYSGKSTVPTSPATLHNTPRLPTLANRSITTPTLPPHIAPAIGATSTNAPTGINTGRYTVGLDHPSAITPTGSKLPDGYIESPIHLNIHQRSLRSTRTSPQRQNLLVSPSTHSILTKLSSPPADKRVELSTQPTGDAVQQPTNTAQSPR